MSMIIRIIEKQIKFVKTLKNDEYNRGYLCALTDCLRWTKNYPTSNSTKVKENKKV